MQVQRASDGLLAGWGLCRSTLSKPALGGSRSFVDSVQSSVCRRKTRSALPTSLTASAAAMAFSEVRYAAVLVGRITGLARPSVCPSVSAPYEVVTWKQKSAENQDWFAWTFPRAGVVGLPILRSKRLEVKVRLGLHMSSRTAAQYVDAYCGTGPVGRHTLCTFHHSLECTTRV